MDKLKPVLVSDLMKMSGEELRTRGVIIVKDLKNLTAEHVEQINALANGPDKDPKAKLAAADKNLRKKPKSKLPEPEDKFARDRLRREKIAYDYLIRNGGRPSHNPSEQTFNPLSRHRKASNIITYWIDQCKGTEDMLRRQMRHWFDFRSHQALVRCKHWNPEDFNGFVQEIKNYRQKKGMKGDICLLQDRERQSKLDDWKEYQVWEYMKADSIAEKIDLMKKERKKRQKKLQAARDAGKSHEEIQSIFSDLVRFEWKEEDPVMDSRHWQNILLKWVDEQLPIISSECAADPVSVPEDGPSKWIIKDLGKRKRVAADIGEVRKRRCKSDVGESLGSQSFPVEFKDTLPVDHPSAQRPRPTQTRSI